MREILFRGKSLSPENYGTWLYGSLLCRPGKTSGETETFIISNLKTDKIRTESTCLVIPETVGQFTSAYDCDDKDIFEGDIVEIFNGWDTQGDLAYVEQDDDFGYAISGFELKLNSQYSKPWADCFIDDSDIPAIKVIGNLYDGIADTEKSETFYRDGEGNAWLKSRIITPKSPKTAK